MNLRRAEGLLILSAASTLALAGCRDRDGSGLPRRAPASASSGGPAARASLAAADVSAYVRGRSREVALMRGALARLRQAGADGAERRAAMRSADSSELERAGAGAAGLGTAPYRALVARVDAVLLALGPSAGREGGSSPLPAPLTADEWRLLDSLRVNLAVLRYRFDAAAGEETAAP